jgi:hypothetical protein
MGSSPVDAVTSSIAEAIRREMGAQDIKTPGLAERCGMPTQTLRNYIRKGSERVMPVTAFVTIAHGLGLTPEVLWERARALREQPSRK